MEFRERKLNDLIKNIIDNRGKNPEKYFDKEKYPVIDNVLIKNKIHPNVNEATRFIDENTFQNFLRGYVTKNMPLMTLVGNGIGNVTLSPNDKVVIIQNTVGFNTKEELNNVYLYYYFLNNKEALRNFNRGTGQPSIKKTDVLNMNIKIPSIENQEKIVRVLLSLDKKIELNNQINDNLLEINKQLYKRWFIDFEFPNKDGKPYKFSGGRMIESELGEIPENWNCKYLEELVDIINGYSYKGKELVKESNIGMVTIKNFDRTGGFKLDGYKPLNPEKIKEQQIVELFDLVVAHTDLTQNADIIGNPVLILNKKDYEKLVISMDLVKVVPKNELYDKFYIFEILNSEKFKKHALGYVSGTTVLHLDKKCIKQYITVIPDSNIVEKFSKIIKINYEKISELIAENQTLEQLRDTLLPKLMNGEIDLDKIEI